MAYRAQAAIDAVVARIKKDTPTYDFVSEDGIRHTVWCISCVEDIATIRDSFANLDQIYIADGHHRAASAVKVGLKRSSEI